MDEQDSCDMCGADDETNGVKEYNLDGDETAFFCTDCASVTKWEYAIH